VPMPATTTPMPATITTVPTLTTGSPSITSASLSELECYACTSINGRCAEQNIKPVRCHVGQVCRAVVHFYSVLFMFTGEKSIQTETRDCFPESGCEESIDCTQGCQHIRCCDCNLCNSPNISTSSQSISLEECMTTTSSSKPAGSGSSKPANSSSSLSFFLLVAAVGCLLS
jgi:hypothetical protein